MVKVTRDKFYSFIGPRDIICSAEGNYPYVSVFKFRNGEIVGKEENDEYFLKKMFCNDRTTSKIIQGG